jgi:dethiobiotin synthetase
MGKIFFVTGTDTGIGKTYVTTGLLRVANSRGLSSIGIKPVSSGCMTNHVRTFHHDATLLQETASLPLCYESINPFAFMPPVAPHIIAAELNTELSAATLISRTQDALSTTAAIHMVEGFGGWHAPLNSRETMADYAAQLGCGIIIVVGIRLGCLNHAILTERAVTASGAHCIGWVANMIDPDMTHRPENIATLQTWLQSPLLGIIQYGQSAADALQDVTIF